MTKPANHRMIRIEIGSAITGICRKAKQRDRTGIRYRGWYCKFPMGFDSSDERAKYS